MKRKNGFILVLLSFLILNAVCKGVTAKAINNIPIKSTSLPAENEDIFVPPRDTDYDKEKSSGTSEEDHSSRVEPKVTGKVLNNNIPVKSTSVPDEREDIFVPQRDTDYDKEKSSRISEEDHSSRVEPKVTGKVLNNNIPVKSTSVPDEREDIFVPQRATDYDKEKSSRISEEDHSSRVEPKVTGKVLNNNIPMKSTSLPDEREDIFVPQRDTDYDKEKSSRTSEEDQSSNVEPRVTEKERPTQAKGTKIQETLTPHYEVRSPEIRWVNIAFLENEATDDYKRKRFRKKRKAGSELIGENDDVDVEDTAEPFSPIIIGAISGGVLAFLCMMAGLACLCKRCMKKCLRRKDPELGLKLPSTSVVLSVDETPAVWNANQPSYQLADTHSDDQAFSVVIDTPKTEACTVIEITEPSSLDASYTCSSLPGSQPATLVSVAPLASKSEILNPGPEHSVESGHDIYNRSPSSTIAAAKPKMSSGSPISLSKITLTFEPNVATEATTSVSVVSNTAQERDMSTGDLSSTQRSTFAFEQTTVPLEAQSTPVASTSFTSDSSQLSPPSHPATPNGSSSLNCEVTRTISMVTESSSSSTESCKTPVAPRNEVTITVQDDEDKEGTNKATDNYVCDVLTSEDEREMIITLDDSSDETCGEPPTPPSRIPPSLASTELKKGKSLIGGRKALENRRFVMHLTSDLHSTGLESDLNTAISRILGEKKRDVDKNREKRLVIKHQTQETKYSLKESILRAKSVIMDENVDKSYDRLLARRRQAIKQTHSPYPGCHGLQPKPKLAREIAFAKTIILPAERYSKSARRNKDKRKFAFQMKGGQGKRLYTGEGEILALDPNKIPQKGCLCRKCDKLREEAQARFFNPPRKQSKLFKWKKSYASSSLKYVVPTPEASTSVTVTDPATSSDSNSDSEDEQQTPC